MFSFNTCIIIIIFQKKIFYGAQIIVMKWAHSLFPKVCGEDEQHPQGAVELCFQKRSHFCGRIS